MLCGVSSWKAEAWGAPDPLALHRPRQEPESRPKSMLLGPWRTSRPPKGGQRPPQTSLASAGEQLALCAASLSQARDHPSAVTGLLGACPSALHPTASTQPGKVHPGRHCSPRLFGLASRPTTCPSSPGTALPLWGLPLQSRRLPPNPHLRVTLSRCLAAPARAHPILFTHPWDPCGPVQVPFPGLLWRLGRGIAAQNPAFPRCDISSEARGTGQGDGTGDGAISRGCHWGGQTPPHTPWLSRGGSGVAQPAISMCLHACACVCVRVDHVVPRPETTSTLRATFVAL